MVILRVVNFGSAKGGLATVGYTIYGVDGSAIGSRITDGVNEIGTNTGIYAASVNMPDYDCIVLWDTGEATPRYSTEDYQHQVTSISYQVGDIRKIYNSIRNQGEFMATLMDKLGLIEKNQGMEKVSQKIDDLGKRENVSLTNIEEAFGRAARNIRLTALAPEVKMPDIKIPDYGNLVLESRKLLTTIKGEIGRIGNVLKNYSDRVDRIDFSSLISKLDTIVTRLSSLDTSDAKISKSRDEIATEIKRLSMFLHEFVSSPYLKEAKDYSGILMALGHKK